MGDVEAGYQQGSSVDGKGEPQQSQAQEARKDNSLYSADVPKK